MFSFEHPLPLVLVILLAAWGGFYVFRLLRLRVKSTDRKQDELNERTARLLDRYRRSKGRRKA
ncbi:MAG: hypothetical protein OXT73_03430 [Bacteroidota bacterium]|nr:hypothetical protein [Bacteroidota bacterium]